MKLKRMCIFALTLALAVVCAGAAMSAAPVKVWQETTGGGTAGNVFFGNVIDETYYVGQIDVGAYQYDKVQAGGTAKLQQITGWSRGAKSAVRIGDYVYGSAPDWNNSVFSRWDYWNPTTRVDLTFADADVIKPDSWSTDGTYLYANTYGGTMNQVQRFSINGTVLTRDWAMKLNNVPDGTLVRTVNYDSGSGKLYAIRALGRVYELNTDGTTSPDVLPIIDLNTGTTTRQCKRVGDKIWVVSDGGMLYKCGLSGGTWSLIDSYNLGLGALYGIGATADGTGLWISSSNSQVSFWQTGDAPVPEPGSMLALGSGLISLAGFAIRRKRA